MSPTKNERYTMEKIGSQEIFFIFDTETEKDYYLVVEDNIDETQEIQFVLDTKGNDVSKEPEGEEILKYFGYK